MRVFPPKEHALHALFGRRKVLIGVVHSRPLPGSPHYDGEPIEDVYDFACFEAERYERGGMHGIILENSWDLPFSKPEDLSFETASAMAVMAHRVRGATNLPIGINVLANGVKCSLAVAKASGAGFVRANQWVNAYVANEGIIEGPAPAASRYRTWLRAQRVKVFADVHVKHGSHAIVADRCIPEQARDAEFFDADVLIATGQRTGGPADPEEVRIIRSGTHLPVIVGSGVTRDNAKEIFEVADGAIIASGLKEGGDWWQTVSVERVEEVVQIANNVWGSSDRGQL